MIRALIVDDEPLSRRAVRQLCARHADVIVAAECSNGSDAATVLRRAPIHVVFLDVKMPGLTGLDVARRRQESQLPLIVFVTAYDQFALPAFDAAAIDYLTKPLNPIRFALALDRVRKQLTLMAPPAVPAARAPAFLQDLVARARDRDILVPLESVEYIAAQDVYAAVHSQTGVQHIRQSLDLLEKQLDPALFIRVHRSYIVQIDYVSAVRRAQRGERTLLLRSGAEVPVSRRRRNALQQLLEQRGCTLSGQ
ncbi:MAG: LytR/AlgR family response regulator transcription factor [Longimicrobiales bacterium]